MEPYGKVYVKLTGDIAENGTVELRDLSKVLVNLQSMLDRAFLDVKAPGKLRKHSRLKVEEYGDVAFYVGNPVRQSFLLDFVANTERGRAVLTRIANAIAPVYARIEASIQIDKVEMRHNVKLLRDKIASGILVPKKYDEADILNDKSLVNLFADKSILKYLDQLISPVRYDGKKSKVEIGVVTDKIQAWAFDSDKGFKLHDVMTERSLGAPYSIPGELVGADIHNKVGDFVKYGSGKKCRIRFASRDEVISVRHLLGVKGVVITVCPLFEFDSYDPQSGDLQFVNVVSLPEAA